MPSVKILLINLFILMMLFSCSKERSNNVVKETPTMSVTATYIRNESLPYIINCSGLIKPWQEAIISSEVSNLTITTIYVNTGDQVTKGQILARLDASQLNADLLGFEANVAGAKAKLEKAKIEVNQAKSLEKAGAISAQELLQYSTTLKTAQAQLKAEIAKLELQKLKIGYTNIIAPDNGIISSRTAAVGNIVIGGNELFRIIRNGILEWQAEVNLDQLSQIKSGQKVKVGNGKGTIIDGTVRQISPILNNSSKNGLVYVDIKKSPDLKVGMSLSGQIYTGIFSGLIVPLKSIVTLDGFNYILLLSATNHVHKVKVQLGTIYNNEIVISSNELSAQSRIVVDGAWFLNESDLVNIVKDNK